MKATQKNRGMTVVILQFLDNKDAAFIDEIYDYVKYSFPTITKHQLGGVLSSLKRREKILHIAPRAYACMEYPYR